MTIRTRTNRIADTVFAAAAGCYVANCALGTSVALRIVDTSGFRWVHHALYIVTAALTGLALSSALWGRSGRRNRAAALALLPAAVPLAALPITGTRGRRHPLIALTAAPFFAAAIARTRST